MSSERVSVIIPTLALPEREPLLQRAIASVLAQEQVTAIPVVVVNGSSFNPRFVAALESDPRIRVIRQQPPDLPSALRLGAENVATPWFTSLDDDDELTPQALFRRVRALQANEGFDAVVTNGHCIGPDGNSLAVSDMTAVAKNPLTALIASNWLLPGAWLCRTDPASRALFDGMPTYLECTYLAIRLCTGRRVLFLAEPTVIWHGETPDSLSKSRAYRFGQADAMRRILELDLPPDLRRCIRRRLSAAYHDTAAILLAEGETLSAWEHHARSVFAHRGWRFIPYTARLIGDSVGLRRAAS